LYFLKQAVAKAEEKSRALRAQMTEFITAEDEHTDDGEHTAENVGAMLEEDGSLNIDHYINHNMEAVEKIERSFANVYSQVTDHVDA
jgi:hypothetical protein